MKRLLGLLLAVFLLSGFAPADYLVSLTIDRQVYSQLSSKQFTCEDRGELSKKLHETQGFITIKRVSYNPQNTSELHAYLEVYRNDKFVRESMQKEGYHRITQLQEKIRIAQYIARSA